jgi:hypothetical protein
MAGAGHGDAAMIDWLATHGLNLGAIALLIAFIVFAFRQGMKVKPLPPDQRPGDSTQGGGA